MSSIRMDDAERQKEAHRKDLQKVAAHIKILSHQLFQYINELKVTSNDAEGIDKAFIFIAKFEIRYIHDAINQTRGQSDFIDFLLQDQEFKKHVLPADEKSPAYRKVIYLGFLLYFLNQKIMEHIENGTEFDSSYPIRNFPKFEENNFAKIIAWIEATKKHFKIDFIQPNMLKHTSVPLAKMDSDTQLIQKHIAKITSVETSLISNTSFENEIVFDSRYNIEFDYIWDEKKSAKENVIKLLSFYIPYPWNVLSHKHNVEEAKVIIDELSKDSYKSSLTVYSFLKKTIKSTCDHLVNAHGEFSRKIDYAIERLEIENLDELQKFYLQKITLDQANQIFNVIKHQFTFEKLKKFWQDPIYGKEVRINKHSEVIKININKNAHEIFGIIFQDNEHGEFSAKKLQSLILKARQLVDYRNQSIFSSLLGDESTKEFFEIIAKINLHDSKDKTTQLFLSGKNPFDQFYDSFVEKVPQRISIRY